MAKASDFPSWKEFQEFPKLVDRYRKLKRGELDHEFRANANAILLMANPEYARQLVEREGQDVERKIKKHRVYKWAEKHADIQDAFDLIKEKTKKQNKKGNPIGKAIGDDVEQGFQLLSIFSNVLAGYLHFHGPDGRGKLWTVQGAKDRKENTKDGVKLAKKLLLNLNRYPSNRHNDLVKELKNFITAEEDKEISKIVNPYKRLSPKSPLRQFCSSLVFHLYMAGFALPPVAITSLTAIPNESGGLETLTVRRLIEKTEPKMKKYFERQFAAIRNT